MKDQRTREVIADPKLTVIVTKVVIDWLVSILWHINPYGLFGLVDFGFMAHQPL